MGGQSWGGLGREARKPSPTACNAFANIPGNTVSRLPWGSPLLFHISGAGEQPGEQHPRSSLPTGPSLPLLAAPGVTGEPLHPPRPWGAPAPHLSAVQAWGPPLRTRPRLAPSLKDRK